MTSTPASLRTDFETYDRRVSEFEGQVLLLDGQILDAADRQLDGIAWVAVYEEARTALEEMEKSWRRQFEEKLAALVSHGLTAVFGEETRIFIETSTKRGATSMALKIEQGGVELGDIIDSTGGSIVSVLSVLLRVMLTVSVRPPLRRLIVLDEPLHGAVDPSHIPTFGTLLRELADRLDLQFIVVAHETDLEEYADRVYEVVKSDGVAHVRQLKTENEERV